MDERPVLGLTSPRIPIAETNKQKTNKQMPKKSGKDFSHMGDPLAPVGEFRSGKLRNIF